MGTNYQIGYRFECRVRKHLECLGYIIIRSGKSRFPDGAALGGVHEKLPMNFIWEAKKNKYLDRAEKMRAGEIAKKVPFFVFWNNKHKISWYSVV